MSIVQIDKSNQLFLNKYLNYLSLTCALKVFFTLSIISLNKTEISSSVKVLVIEVNVNEKASDFLEESKF